MGNSDTVFITIALFLIAAIMFGNTNVMPSGSIIDPTSCNKIEGVVIAKEQNEDGNILYVELDYQDSVDGYILYVSNETYEAYNVGYIYENWICDLIEYNNIRNIINEMLTWDVVSEWDAS